MCESSERAKGYRFPKLIISYAVYLYHRFLRSYRDVQELLFERGIDVSHETIRIWCAKFGPELAEALRYRKPRHGRIWHLDEMRVVLGGVTHWLWRAINEHGEILDVLLQERRDTDAAKRFFRRLTDDQELPERIITDGLRSYRAALKELPKLDASEHTTVSAAERQNNLIEQSHRPTRDQERQQRGFRGVSRAQCLCRGFQLIPPYVGSHSCSVTSLQLAQRLRFVARAVALNPLSSWWSNALHGYLLLNTPPPKIS